jgi:hypothetical protein
VKGGGQDPSVGISGEKVGLTPRPEIQQVLEAPTDIPVKSRRSLPCPQEGPHQGLSVWDVVCFLRNLSILVPYLEIQWSLGRKRTLGTMNMHRSVPHPASPMPLFPSEPGRVETVEAPPPVG